MKRERDLIQKLLLKLEEWPAKQGDVFVFSGPEPELAIEGYSVEQVEYHLTLIKSEGYIDSPGSQPMVGITFRSLTPRGHDLVDKYRETMAAEASEQWISAAEAVKLLKPALKGSYSAQMRICARAHAGLVRARADRFMMDERSEDNFEIPKEFWWAEGREALKQDWEAGDFDTWLKNTHHLRAFGVSFLRANVEKMIPANTQPTAAAPTSASTDKVFLVHGRDDAAKNEVALFLRAIGLHPIILHLQPNGGRHLLTKFMEESEGAGFAVVLMTPDDEGGIAAAGSYQPRARQNVVFELGFLLGN